MVAFKSFEEIEAWKEACRLSVDIFRITAAEKFSRQFALREQMRKAALSIPSNIAEGFERGSDKDFAKFLYIAKASAGELRTHLYIARSLEYLSEARYKSLVKSAKAISSKVGTLIKYLKKAKR